MKVYGHPRSYSCHKVFWALRELDQEFEFALVDLVKGEHKRPGVARLNPNQPLPVLDDDGFTLYGSGAILACRAETHGGRALAAQWLLWEAAQLGPAMVKPWLLKFGEGLGAPFDAGAHAAAIEATQRPLRVLDGQLAGRRFVVGDEFTIAHVSLGETVYMREFARVSLEAYPHVRAWFEGLARRPTFARSRHDGCVRA